MPRAMKAFDIASSRDSTASRQAYWELRHAIRRGELVYGELYSIAQIAKHLGISRTPVREAVCKLEAESLVETLPQRGFRLRAIPVTEIEEFMALREMLETYVVRTLIDLNEPSAVLPVAALLDQQESCIDDDDEFIYLAEELHITLAKCAGLPRVAWILEALRGQLWLLGTQSLLQPNRRASAVAEHRAILDCIVRGERAKAEAAMRQHLSNTAEAYRGRQARAGQAQAAPTPRASNGPSAADDVSISQ